MLKSLFVKGYEALIERNRIFLWIVVAQTVVILFLGWSLMVERVRVVDTPPYLDKAVRIGYATASKDYLDSWGLYVAELVGNLSPGSASYTADALGKLFSSDDFNAVKSKVLATAQLEKADNMTFVFDARKTIWQPENRTVFVYGHLKYINDYGRQTANIPYTFSMTVHIDAGRPVLGSFESYKGEPHTIAWVLKHGGKNS